MASWTATREGLQTILDFVERRGLLKVPAA